MASRVHYTAVSQGEIFMLRRVLPVLLAAAIIAPALAQTKTIPPTFPQLGVLVREKASATYYPERFDWQHKKAEDVGRNGAAINEAAQLAINADTPGPHDMP